ncbi:hypothetical protein [Carboxylicivirga marina]|uniref:Uncharacterized protein n=1 Tax=Carboxylicivirga marina TaxID=2800988 RepID=A0ABS1HQ11_9BACT|nr:hypothetical protein [Carboxylicivirga marina]MBK3519767.1 hypothetical protein [Carboxylicivirga marina]
MACISPYVIGVTWLGLYSALKSTGDDNLTPKSPSMKYGSITNVLDVEKLSFKNYSKCVFWAWVVQTAYWTFDLLN